MKLKIRKAICLLLLSVLLLQTAACTAAKPEAPKDPASGNNTADPTVKDPVPGNAVVDLMAQVKPDPNAKPETLRAEDAARSAQFALELFRAGAKAGENRLISPLSVLCALSMTANGAKGDTLAQMEQVLGMDRNRLNRFFRSYLATLPDSADCRLKLANSIWFADRGDFRVNDAFLQTNADYYGAELYKAPFNEQTLAEINSWVKRKTEDMIPSILDEIPEDAVMYLINALAFDAKWANPYSAYNLAESEFALPDGTKRNVTLMYSQEDEFLEDENAVGFLKPYQGGRYAFAALLPKEGMSPEEYLATLDGEKLLALLGGARALTVYAGIPRFETDYSTELSEQLKGMGMELPFSQEADLSGLGTVESAHLRISRVLHKTYIAVDEAGTKAGAATAVEVVAEGAMELGETRQVYLDRPFVYLLLDRESNLPFFIGVMNNPAE